MILPRLNDQQIFAALRVTCGVHLLLQQLFVQAPRFFEFYGVDGMVDPSTFQFYVASPLFLIWSFDFLKVLLFVFTILMSLMFTLGLWARYVHIPLFALTLTFQLANPVVIHEPQQLLQLLLFVLWFVPYESTFRMTRSPGFESYEYLEERWGVRIVFLLQAFLGFYYLLAGLKKLPDPSWRTGEALKVFLSSPHLARAWVSTEWLSWPPLLSAATYGTLAFELLFIFLIFTNKRGYLFIFGLLFHFAILMLFDVGFFWAAMWMWYPLLLFVPPKRAATP